MAAPTSDDLAEFTGKPASSQSEAVIGIVSALAASYTRGQGFTAGVPADDVRAVILSASARLLSDPTGNLRSETAGPFSKTYGNGFVGWTVAELAVLNRYRARAV